MSANSKKVSIVIPCHNYENYIREALDSSLNQTYKNIEIVVVNDASSDNSAKIIQDYAKKHENIVFIDNKTNKGVVNCRNEAIEICKGEYIMPLDADDVLENTYIEKAVKILDTIPDVGIVYSRANLIGDENKCWKLAEYDKDEFLFRNCILTSSLFRKDDFFKAGKYKEYMEHCGAEDWELWISIIELGLKPYRINEYLFKYRLHGKNSRSSIVKINNVKRELLKHHLSSYLNNEIFINGCFMEHRRYKKYKKLYIAGLIISVIELVLILGVLFIVLLIK